MSLNESQAYQATFHLLSSRKNADRLDRAINNLRAGRGAEHQFFEEESESIDVESSSKKS